MRKKNKIILASASQRRLCLLNQIGLHPSKTLSPNINESAIKYKSLIKTVREIAYKKAEEVRKLNKIENKFIIAADTMVSRAGKIYDKANDCDEVKKFLKELSGKKHLVLGGICVISPEGKISKKVITTEVFFKIISNEELNTLSLLEDGVGKAGGYAIQSLGSILVKKIKGSFSNVVGLSLFDVFNMLVGLGWKNSV